MSRLTHPAKIRSIPAGSPGGEERIDEILGDAGLTRPSHEPDSPGRWRHVPSTNSLVNKRGDRQEMVFGEALPVFACRGAALGP